MALDLLGPLPRSDSGNAWVMVVGDYCSKWMEAYPLPDARAVTVADKFVKEFVCRFGVPLELHSDQGTNFESAVFAEMCRVLGISKTRTTAYNPKSDGMVERYNKTMVNMVAMMIEPKRQQGDWDECPPYASFAYRCTPQESTGESPNMMMLGREVRLPVDLMVECPSVEDTTRTDYAEALRHNLQEAHTRARECLRQSARRQKRNYDRKVHGQGLKEGQFVWLFNKLKKKGRSSKLQLRWEGPYLVVKRLSDVTFRVQLKRGSKAFVVHGDRLKPYEGKPLEPWAYKPKRVVEVHVGDPHEVALESGQNESENVRVGDEPEVVLVSGHKDMEEVSEEPERGLEPTAGSETSPTNVVGQTGLDIGLPGGEETSRRYPKRGHRLPVRFR